MSDAHPRHDVARRELVCRVPDADVVTVHRDVPYAVADGEQLTLDVYAPRERRTGIRAPVVLFVTGFPDAGMRRAVGCNAKDMTSYISWARLVAASGLVAVTYTTRRPATEVHDVIAYLGRHADRFGIDTSRVGIWSCSGNVPTALSALMSDAGTVRCAVLLYGFMLDLDGSTSVADAARTFRFDNPCAGMPLERLAPDVSLFIVRAGRDELAHVNDSIDAFAAGALRLNLPVTLVNHRDAPHAFDTSHDSDTSREIIRRILEFLRFQLEAV
jgi:hypothetical protein